jgi:hypothetical protein
MNVAIPTIEASLAAVNIASELTSRKIKHGAEMSRNLRVSRGSKPAGVAVTSFG